LHLLSGAFQLEYLKVDSATVEVDH